MLIKPTTKDWLVVTEVPDPVFWISEFRILSTLSAEKSEEIRHVELQRGLNIIWSEPGNPKGNKSQRGRGHAAGKTSFCRALRYLLGENNFGNKFVEEKVAGCIPLSKSVLYASIWVDGTQWSVFRPLNRHHRRSLEFAVKGAGFYESLAIESDKRESYSTFQDALEAAVISPFKVQHYDHRKQDQIKWLDALLPLARDQEAHLSSLHNWRDASAGQIGTKFVPAVRAFLMRCLFGVADPDEAKELQARSAQATIITTAEKALATYREVLIDEIEDLETLLDEVIDRPTTADIHFEDDSLFLAAIRTKTLEKSQKEKSRIQNKISDLKLTDLANKISIIQQDIARIEGRISERQELLEAQRRMLKAFQNSEPTELEEEQALCERLLRNTQQKGRFCKVPIQDAIEGCQLYWKCEIKKMLSEEPKTVTAEFVEQKRRILQMQVSELEKEMKPHFDKISSLKQQLNSKDSLLSKQKESEVKLLEGLKQVDEDCREAIQSARNIQHAITRQETARGQIIEAVEKTKIHEARLSDLRKKGAIRQDEISQLFDFIIKELVSDELTGNLVFSKIDINATLKRSGELESEAYKALRCLAYDYTALLGRLYGIGHHPGFLIHDSPRESDLEYSLYQQLFTFTHKIEKIAPSAFQYIITTTESPPADLVKSHVRLNLDGSKKEGRLYRQHL